mmetsp:Transcript_26026/g.74627  ORF Transcript_26026/g.74627 Transcript_26026/m.74627 type:complete len:293 (-) Transcript_26026:135-1013(-)
MIVARTWPFLTGRQSSSEDAPMSSLILDHGGLTYSSSFLRPFSYLSMFSASAFTFSCDGSSLGTKLQTLCAESLWVVENWIGGGSKAPMGIRVPASHTKDAPPGSLTPSRSRATVYTGRPRSLTSSRTASFHCSSTSTASTILPLGMDMPMLSNFSRSPARSSFILAFTSGCSSSCWAREKPRLPRALSAREARVSSHKGNASTVEAPASPPAPPAAAARGAPAPLVAPREDVAAAVPPLKTRARRAAPRAVRPSAAAVSAAATRPPQAPLRGAPPGRRPRCLSNPLRPETQ